MASMTGGQQMGRIRLLTKPERKLSWLLPPLSNN
nr:33 amino acid polypeptide; NcoI site (105) allows cloning at translation initiation (ATG); BamHI (141) allows cloning at 12 and EspI (193) at 30 amino acids downstream from ATG [Cloning vector pSIT]